MQWLRQKKSEDPADFWHGVETRRGGPVTFSTFATLAGSAGGGRVDLAGLLYVVNAVAWFEDFEKDNWLYRVVGAGKKYEKTEVSFALAEVTSVRFVSKMQASQRMAKAGTADILPETTRLFQFFSTPFVQVALKSGTTLYFDMLEGGSSPRSPRRAGAEDAPGPPRAPGMMRDGPLKAWHTRPGGA